MKKQELFFSSEKKNGKEFLSRENLHTCTKKCYNKFFENKMFILYKKSDEVKKENGQWVGICKKCGNKYSDYSRGCFQDDCDTTESVIGKLQL